MSWEPLSELTPCYILRNWKILNLQKAWPQYKLGDTPPKWPLNGTLAFAKAGKGLRISIRSVLHGPQSESRFEGLMPHVFLLPPYLLSPFVSLHQIS